MSRGHEVEITNLTGIVAPTVNEVRGFLLLQPLLELNRGYPACEGLRRGEYATLAILLPHLLLLPSLFFLWCAAALRIQHGTRLIYSAKVMNNGKICCFLAISRNW